ncbi:MAG: DUF192 domain-containing protein [Candidatus Omnitrophica bacterium]|nr:DUF192 domain-containing protein [Candidatus Omnitrophota bacterium]
MSIRNATRNTSIAHHARIARSLSARLKGLLGEEAIYENQALILRPCNSVHTFFMRFPIDVIFVDHADRVVKTISCLRPFRMTGIYFSAAYAIELPPGTIASTCTELHDILTIEK